MKPARVAWIIGGVGVVASAIGAFAQPESFAFAWLAALTVWLWWPLGCLALLLVHALTGGRWGHPVRPYLVLGISVLPLLIPAAIPLLFLLPRLYPWVRSGVSAQLANGFYLNPSFAAVRWIFYLVVWFGASGFALLFLRRKAALTVIAAPGLILLGLTFNFAAIDSIMSLDPYFNSSAFGMITAAECALFALSITILTTVLGGEISTPERDDLGRLLQGLLILWAYLDFMQVLIIWQSDLPKEATWYLARSGGMWGEVAALTAVAHFLLPFLVLLIPGLRRSRGGIIATTSLLIAMTVIRGWWLVLPTHERGIDWIDGAALLALGGISIGLVLRGPSPRWQTSNA